MSDKDDAIECYDISTSSMAIKKLTKKTPSIKKEVLVTSKKLPKKISLKTSKSSKQAAQDSLLRTIRAAAKRAPIKKPHQLERHESNPIIEPREGHYWEMKATFNPGAVYADHRVHLLYRALGGDDTSVLGYASSEDGISFDDRPDEPAYTSLVTKKTQVKEKQIEFSPAYFSGGGWNGGCEDPRLTIIDRKVYLTYTAFDGWGSLRIGLSSISLKDFLNKNWKWKKPAMISPQGEIHKNWMLFPEKINGRFAILHSIAPRVMVDYFDSLENFDEEENVIKGSIRKMEVNDPERWEFLVRGAGPPPLKIKDGWLLLYHAEDRRDPGKYKLGAMILDLNDPTKVLYRAQSPILEPDFEYERNGWKSGVVYSCGAVIKDRELYVYYGGGDTVVCVAMANLEKFLHELKIHGTPKLQPDVATKSKITKRNGGN